MGDGTIGNPAPVNLPVAAARVALPPAAPPAAVTPRTPTDQLTLSQPAGAAPAEPFLGHKAVAGFGSAPAMVRASVFMKVPVWNDTQAKVTVEDWNHLGEPDRAAILAALPNDNARNYFQSLMNTKNSFSALTQSAQPPAAAPAPHPDDTAKAAAALDRLAQPELPPSTATPPGPAPMSLGEMIHTVGEAIHVVQAEQAHH